LVFLRPTLAVCSTEGLVGISFLERKFAGSGLMSKSLNNEGEGSKTNDAAAGR
jgi:hypothetical protein